MTPSRLRKIVVLYPLLMILCGIGYAKYDRYQLDGDAVAFMDIADALRVHDMGHAVNGYWNPAYAGALMLGEVVAHPTRWSELQTFFWVNFFIFVACIFACLYFVRSLLLVRDRFASDDAAPPALSPGMLALFALALVFASFQRELGLGAVRSDALLLLFLILAASFLLRLQSSTRHVYFPLLGLALGLAFLTKSFAFLPSGLLLGGIFVFGLTRRGSARRRIVGGSVVGGIVFLALAGPYIAAISKQRGRPTTGESARLNYAFFVDGMGRWHEWHSGDYGHATATFKHHEALLLDTPAVYTYAEHPVGTYPLWFDPSYWTDTVHPRFYAKGHLQRLLRCTALLIRFLTGHLEGIAILLLLLLAGCFFPRQRAFWVPFLPVLLLGVVITAIYFPIDLQDRYLTSSLFFIMVPLLALVRRPASGYQAEFASGAVLVFAALLLANAVNDLGERRRLLSVEGYPRGAYSKKVYGAAHALDDLGIGPGKDVACFGDQACYVDHYWARLAGTPIRAEIEVPRSGDPGAYWESLPDKDAVVEALRRQKIDAIVGIFASTGHVPAGWQKLGIIDMRGELSEFQGEAYVYPLDPVPAR